MPKVFCPATAVMSDDLPTFSPVELQGFFCRGGLASY